MPKPKFPYAGDAALKRLLERYRCPAPFHVVRMRFWGEIVSPSLQASPIKTIESLWPSGLPTFNNRDEANAFFQALMSLWNNVARFQSGSPPLKLQKVDNIDTRVALHAAAKLRVEELLDGFMHGFTGGNRQIDVPPGVGDLLGRIEKGIELAYHDAQHVRQAAGGRRCCHACRTWADISRGRPRRTGRPQRDRGRRDELAQESASQLARPGERSRQFALNVKRRDFIVRRDEWKLVVEMWR